MQKKLSFFNNKKYLNLFIIQFNFKLSIDRVFARQESSDRNARARAARCKARDIFGEAQER